MDIIHDLLGYDRIKIFQNNEMFSFSLDSILLADFVSPKAKTKKIIDLGTGNAPIPMFLTLKTKAEIVAVEIQKEVYNLAHKGIEFNGFCDQIKLVNADIKGVHKTVGGNLFDIAISNPPFFKYQEDSNINKHEAKTIARHEVLIKLEDIIKESRSLLNSVGSLYMVNRCERLSEVIELLAKYKFGLKRLRFIYTKQNSSSKMFLLEARANMASDVVIESPLYIYDSTGEYTLEVKNIFNYKN